MILCISVLSVVISPFSFLILLIWFFLFVSWWVWLMVCQFYLSSQRTSFWLCWFLLWFVSFAFISALIFKISFLLLSLGFFITSFSSCFRCRVRLFIWLFSCFLMYAFNAMNFPLSTAFIVLLNCGVGEDFWESLGLQGDPTSPFWRRSTLGFLWKEWC